MKKIPLTPVGIEPATFRFVAQHLNHCATAKTCLHIFLPKQPEVPTCTKKDPFSKAGLQENRQEDKYGENWSKWPPNWRRSGKPPNSARTANRRARAIVKGTLQNRSICAPVKGQQLAKSTTRIAKSRTEFCVMVLSGFVLEK